MGNSASKPLSRKIRGRFNDYNTRWSMTMLNSLLPYLNIGKPRVLRSRVMAEVGKWTGEGLAVGIEGTKSRVQQSIEDLGYLIIDVAQHYLDEEKKITEVAKAEIAKIEKRSKEDIDKIYRAAYSKKRKTTQEENIKIQRMKEDTAKKIVDIEKKAAKDSAMLAGKAQKATLEEIKLFINDKKSLDQLTVVEEAKIWAKSVDLFEDGTKEKIEAQKNYKTAISAINKEIETINKNFQGRMNKIDDDRIKKIDDLQKSYKAAKDAREQEILSPVKLFDAFEIKEDETSGDQLFNNAQSQLDGLKFWRSELEKLASKPIDADLLAEIRELGPSALPQLIAMNEMTAEQLDQYSAMYREKFAFAREVAGKELEGMKTVMEKNIKAVNVAANGELAALQDDWALQIRAITAVTDDELSSLEQVGKNAGKGLLEGLSSMSDDLKNQAISMATTIRDEIAKVLDIPSDSLGLNSSTLKSVVNATSAMAGKLGSVQLPLAKDYAIPAAVGGSSTKEKVIEKTEVHNYERMLEGATFVIREEADIKKIARELFILQQQSARGRGG